MPELTAREMVALATCPDAGVWGVFAEDGKRPLFEGPRDLVEAYVSLWNAAATVAEQTYRYGRPHSVAIDDLRDELNGEEVLR